MADYSEIKGFNVQVLSADPPAPGVGQVWYNTTTGTLKAYGQIGTGAWTSGGNVNTPRSDTSGVGVVTAALILGGQPTPQYKVVESYNGTSWTTGTSMSDNHYSVAGSAGTQTAAIVFGSWPAETQTETWNGTSWSEGGTLNTGRDDGYSATKGTVTAALCAGGGTPPIPASPANVKDLVELYNGTAWTETTAMNASKRGGGGAGTQTNALCWSGYPPSTGTEAWDGTTWTELTDMGTSRYHFGNSGETSTSAMAAGGTYPPGNRLTIVEAWDGASWTEVADLSSQREDQGGCGTAMAALVATGLGPAGTATNVSEEWAIPTTTKTFSAS
jgi:hypothetical protein